MRKPKNVLNISKIESGITACVIPVRYCEYKISNELNKMSEGKIIGFCDTDLLLEGNDIFQIGSLLRILVEIEGYWLIKSKYVEYESKDPPHVFQLLARTDKVQVGEFSRNTVTLSKIVSIDEIDLSVMMDYLKVIR